MTQHGLYSRVWVHLMQNLLLTFFEIHLQQTVAVVRWTVDIGVMNVTG